LVTLGTPGAHLNSLSDNRDRHVPMVSGGERVVHL